MVGGIFNGKPLTPDHENDGIFGTLDLLPQITIGGITFVATAC